MITTRRHPTARRRIVARITAGAVVASVAVGISAAAATPASTHRHVPVPLTTGPVTGGNGIFDLNSDVSQLPTYNYVQQEYFVEGTATAYDSNKALTSDGRWKAVPVSTAPYRTRMIVRRPADPAKFNGTVVLEWLNVTAGFDTAPDWNFGRTELLRKGYAWVGLSAQYVGVEGGIGRLGFGGLKATDPVRYGTLSHPGDDYSYDMFSQAGMALRTPNGVDPLDGLRPKRLIADGESQSASRMTTYVDAIAPLAKVFDAYLVHSRSSSASVLHSAPAASSGPQTTYGATIPNPTFIRTDRPEPVLVLESENDVLRHLAARQKDNDHFRLWEIAGTSHVDAYGLGPAAIAFLGCDKPVNSGPHHYLVHTALRDLDRWLRDRHFEPPHGRSITTDATPDVARDGFGNALGGIRTPELDVPIATLSGFGNTPAGFCGLFGTTTPFTPSELNAVYGSNDQFVARFVSAEISAIRKGFMLPDDVYDILFEAVSVPSFG